MIIPAYNEAETLADTIRSLRAQSVLPDEIIVVDDCSTEGTGSVARQLGVTVLGPPRNTGSKAGVQHVALPHVRTSLTIAIDADTTLAPDAIGRLEDEPDSGRAGRVSYQSDQADGPTAGSQTLDALEFLARVVRHLPDKGQVLPRSYGWDANRTRGVHRKHLGADGGEEPPPVVVEAPADRSRQEARRRWADLLRSLTGSSPISGPARPSTTTGPVPRRL